jgi:hypothetical protein
LTFPLWASGPALTSGTVRVLTLGSCRLRSLQGILLLSKRIHPYHPLLIHFIIRPTAPRPISRVTYEFSFHRVGVHIIQFLPHFPPIPNIEIVKTSLPQMLRFQQGFLEIQSHLSSRDPSPLSAHRPRGPLLQYLNHLGEIACLGLADQQMNMIRHHDIPGQTNPLPHSHLIKNFHETIACATAPQQRLAPITTECDEMQMAVPVISTQWISHNEMTHALQEQPNTKDKRQKSKSAPLETKGCGTRRYFLFEVVPG